MAGGPLALWNHWTTQILVLLSLALQVLLLLLAGIRRRGASTVLRILLWQAYLLADSTAIYAVGHLSLSSAPQEHQLVAFWAPFLLLHLGGPDNITAYALEDSKLWLRHLQNLVVQVLGAAYVLIKHLAGGDVYLLLAAVLMFAVGVVKYAERIRALKCGNLDGIRGSLKKPLPKHHHFHPLDQGPSMAEAAGEEFFARRAHSMFHVCKHAIVDTWIEKDPENTSVQMLTALRREVNRDYKRMWTLMEMELSLMYDLLYTKAGVIHTWLGYSIRFFSPLAAAASLMLFQFSFRDGHSRVDVAVTYTLLAGAVLLETVSLLKALGSTWTYAFLCTTPWSWLRYTALCTGKWDRLRRFVLAITGRGGSGRSARRWSGKMGQFNLLHYCSHNRRAKVPLLGRLARMLGFKEWWIRYHYSTDVDISDYLKDKLFRYVYGLSRRETNALNAQGVIRKNWGQQALQQDKYMGLYNHFKKKNLLGVEFQEGIIIWHISTDVFLAKRTGVDDEASADLVNAIRTLSNYMMFLLVEHPHMLPGLSQSPLYRLSRKNLVKIWNDNVPNASNGNMYTVFKGFVLLHDDCNFAGPMGRDKLATILYEVKPGYSSDVPRLKYANQVAEKLLEEEKVRGSEAILELLRDVWIDFLVYASNRCSRESHARKLGNGGELTIILWLMTNYLHQEDYARKPEEDSDMV